MTVGDLTLEQRNRFWRFVTGDDMDFYEAYLADLPEREQREFFKENPGFLSEYSVSIENIGLLKELSYRNIMRRIKAARS